MGKSRIENPGTAHKVYNVLVIVLWQNMQAKMYAQTQCRYEWKKFAMVGKMLGLKVKIFMA